MDSQRSSRTGGSASALLEAKIAERRIRRELQEREQKKSSVVATSTTTDAAPPLRGEEDALDAKIRRKKEAAAAVNNAAASAISWGDEDALDAKIRRKKEAEEDAAAAANAASWRRRRGSSSEEEKVEIGHSESSDDDDIMFESRGGGGSGGGGGGGGGVSSGVPVVPPSGNGGGGGGGGGGGDVRTRPKPSLSQVQRRVERRGGKKDENGRRICKTDENGKQINPRFAEMHETGQWGGLSRIEKYGICTLTIGVIVAAVVLGLKFGGGGGGGGRTSSPTSPPVRPPTSVPTSSPTLAPTDTYYRAEEGLERMRDASSTSSSSSSLPASPDELVGSKSDASSTPQALAAEFVLYDDPLGMPARDPRFLERYALSVLYYANGGCSGSWTDEEYWMSEVDHCEGWHGVICDLKGRIVELNLSNNGVTGNVPVELSALTELGILDMSNNALSGTVPHEALSMGKLYTIKLNGNSLEGEFPFKEVKEGATILGNLWIQENADLTGTITDAYCGLNSITLDCDNYGPKPVYGPDGILTTFQVNCMAQTGSSPREYTCNFEEPAVSTIPPATAPSSLLTAICGIPVAS